VCYLKARGIEVHDAELGGNFIQDAEVHVIIEGGVETQVGSVGLE